jgi:hypothetical protein
MAVLQKVLRWTWFPVRHSGREGQRTLNSEWLIYKIDGRRSIKAIANASSHSTFDACKILYGLIATNLIRLKEPAAAPAPPRPPSPAPAATGTGPTARPATASLPRQATIPPGSMPQASLEFIQRLLRIRDTAVALLGAGGEAVVQKHVIAARLAIERGAGVEVVDSTSRSPLPPSSKAPRRRT